MTKRQVNITYFKLKRQVDKLRKEYWGLFEMCAEEKGKMFWLFDSEVWVALGSGKVGRIANMRFDRDVYKRRIKILKEEVYG